MEQFSFKGCLRMNFVCNGNTYIIIQVFIHALFCLVRPVLRIDLIRHIYGISAIVILVGLRSLVSVRRA